MPGLPQSWSALGQRLPTEPSAASSFRRIARSARTPTEAIAVAAHGHEMARLGRIGLDALAQPQHGRVHDARDDVFVLPDVVEQMRAGEGAALVLRKALEQGELERGETEFLPVPDRGARLEVDGHPAESQDALAREPALTVPGAEGESARGPAAPSS